MSTRRAAEPDTRSVAAEPLRFEEIWEHRGELRELCQRIVGDPALADDLVQETYLQALRNLDHLERRGGLMPWLVTVAKRRSLNELRRRRYSTPVDVMPDRPTAPEADPVEAVSVSDEVARVQDVLATLTPREHDLLMRQVYEGMSLAQLASAEHTSVASVRSVLSRARGKIRAAVEEAGSRVLAPVAAFLAWVRRRLGPASARAQRVAPALPGGLERFGELVAASVLTIALGASGGTVLHAPDAPDAALGVAPSRPGAPVTAASHDVGAGLAAAGGAAALSSRAAAEPSLTDALPIDPGNPLPEAQQPEDAAYEGFYSPAQSGSGGSREIFALGSTMGRCQVNCTVLFHSFDGGATWKRLPAAGLVAAWSLHLAPAYPQDPRIYAMGRTGLQVSRDGGRTFEPVLAMPHRGPTAMSPGFSRGDQRILVGSAPAWEYDAGGGTAQPIAGAPVGGAEVRFAFPPDYLVSHRLFAGAMAAVDGSLRPAVFTCDRRLGSDMCESRTVLDALRSVPRVAVSSTFARDGVVFAWGAGGAFRSGDAGASFDPIRLPFASVTAITDDAAGTFYASGYDPVADGTRGGVAVSNDGGRTWRLLGAGTALEQGVATVTAVPGGPVLAGPLASAGGGVLCSVDRGATWSPRCPVA